ncbi:hypothetical protein [Parafrankia sp. EUN1f]|uniref:hypothetical protein n=1 Tax=Parafrankia sp. EUN1f TaxID=102897 RepID=UPI0001C459D4|nr:hypothetical protein [Parafrankia sp. EUN1f]EFC84589.1 hypothetical protein FrEUN1fDRAFT_2248 [Parafrankia sp. EUN1f]
MNAMTRIGGFGLALAVLFGVSYVVGTTIGPSQDSAGPAGGAGQGISAGAGGAAGGTGDGAAAADGLAISAGGYTLDPDELTWPAGRSSAYKFRILGADGRPVTAFTRAHDADLHLIVVRRDLTGYQHLHPTRDAAGTWSVPLRLAAAGVYRVFVDFVPASTGTGSHTGATNGITLGADLTVAGDLRPAVLPELTRNVTLAGGYSVTMQGRVESGESSTLAFTVAHNGRPVTDLETYLGALGHLVVIRQGDLAYLHVHPGDGGSENDGDGHVHADGATAAADESPELSFATRFPSAGSYRLYLDFKHGGQVRTAEITMDVAAGRTTSPTRPAGTATPAHVH